MAQVSEPSLVPQRVVGPMTRFLYKEIVLVLILLISLGLGVALVGTYRLSTDLIESQALQQARLSARSLNEAWSLYSQSSVGRLANVDEVTISPDYHQLDNAVPVPATYAIELGRQLSSSRDGSSVRLYSAYPFLNRTDSGGPKDEFERQALDYFQTHPLQAFYRKETVSDRLVFRYAEAVIMQPSCVACHNSLPESPKQDWRVGDVRGAIAVDQPIDRVALLAEDGLRSISIALSVIGGLACASAAFVFGYLRNINRVLQDEVRVKTAALQKLAILDALTELANRRCFDETLQQEWNRMRRQRQPLSLAICDVDYFKRYNDTYGHQAGDKCLRAIASVLRENIQRAGNLPARYGGEEFAVIMPSTDETEAARVANKILQAIRNLNITHNKSDVATYVTISIGIATTIPQEQDHPDDLINRADRALYEAKLQGRDRFVTESPVKYMPDNTSE
ncbi:MAG: diguanylate cyclase [Cyanobacteria bacterium P01_D01_bin.123]